MAESSLCFENGITVATDKMDGIETISVSVLVKAGSRHEIKENNGISHFLEHMAFKGTNTRTALQIAEEFDNIGGYFNAYTSREKTVYYAKVLKQDLPVAVDILSDILQNSVFSEEEMDKERGVILQEIAQTEDTPDDLVFDHFQEAAYPDQPFGRSILGTPDFIKSVSRAQVMQYIDQNYCCDNLIIAGAGNFEMNSFVNLIREKFVNFSKTSTTIKTPARYFGGDKRTFKDLEQVHIVLGINGVSNLDDDYYIQQVLSIIVGGGMSSRLFQEIREKRGLAYAVSSFSSSYADSGIFGVYVGTNDLKANESIDVMIDELKKMCLDVREDELQRAKAQVRAGLLMGQESSISRAEKLAGNYAAYGRYIQIAEVMEKIDAIDLNGIKRFAINLLSQKTPITLASIGKINKLYEYDVVMKKLEL